MRKIKGYVEHELNIFRRECNFSDEELIYFNFKARGYSNVRVALEMNSSTATVTRIGQSVLDKMKKVENYHADELL